MSYISGGLIEATDYNEFVSTGTNNINDVWAAGTGDTGYGQTALATVSAAGLVTATQWAALVNTVAAAADHQGTSITARSAPVTGNTISILNAVATDVAAINSSRLNAVANGSQFTGWTGTNSKTTATTGASWAITFTNTVTFGSADEARYFFNAGGRIKIETSKTSTGDTGDPEWNDLANTLAGDIYITTGTATQTIAGQSYTGTTKFGGTGTPTVLTTGVGWYDLTEIDQVVYQQFADTAPYTSNYISHALRRDAGSTQLIITTVWANNDSDGITGGTAASGATPGTAPCTIVTYFPPSTTYLTQSWGTPGIAASVS